MGNGYLEVLAQHLLRTGSTPGIVRHVEVRHDDECGIFDDSECNCSPVVETGARIDRKYRPRRRGQK